MQKANSEFKRTSQENISSMLSGICTPIYIFVLRNIYLLIYTKAYVWPSQYSYIIFLFNVLLLHYCTCLLS